MKLALTLLTSLSLVKRTTSGNTVQALAVLVRKYILTAAKNTAAVSQAAVSAVNVTDLWKFGTLYLRSSTRTRTATITVYRILTLIRVWVLKDLPLLCKVLTIFLRLTLFKTL